MPTDYAGDTKGAPEILLQLLEVGALKPSDKGERVYDLLQTGVENLMPECMRKFEDANGEEWVQFHFGPEGIQMSMYQACHEWRMRLKPIVTALSDDDALAFIKVLHTSAIQGSCWWDEIADFGGDDDEPPEGEEQDDLDARMRLRKQKPAGPGGEWLKALFVEHPCLEEKQRTQTLMEVMIPSTRRKTPPELRAMIDEFAAATSAAKPYTDNAAIMVTTWDKHCHINHAHDYLLNAIHSGDIDNQDGAPFAFNAHNIKELKEGLEIIGRFIAAATKLEEWSNATS